MPTTTLTPIAVGSPDEWGLVGANKVDAVQDDDGDTSYVLSGDNGSVQAFTLSAPDWGTPPPGATLEIVSVTARSVAKQHESAGAAYRQQLALGASVVESGNLIVTITYATHQTPLARPGGGDWTAEDVEALVARLYGASAVNRRVRVTLLKVDVAFLWVGGSERPRSSALVQYIW